jgi:hypothetical protein
MESDSIHSSPLRKAPAPRRAFASVILIILAVFSGGMLMLAVPNLVGGEGITLAIKAVLLAAGGVVVSFAVNKLAVERGAPLAAANYSGAAIVSVLSIAVVGIGLFSATYAGLVIKDVDRLVVEQHGEELGQLISQQTNYAAEAGRIVPAMSAIVTDLSQKYACEREASCLSGFSGGGDGPAARLLLEKLGRAQALQQEVQRGEFARDDAVQDLSALYAQYRSMSSSDLDPIKKRTELSELDLQIKQAASRLKEAVPVELLRAYASELKSGADIPGRPETAAKLSAVLYQHGASLEALVATIPEQVSPAPFFPKSPGVTDTFSHMGHFLPVAAIAAVVELIVPISLWLYTFFALSWADYQVSPAEPARLHPEDEALQRLLAGPGRRLEDRRAAMPPAPPMRAERRGGDRSPFSACARRDN